MTLIDLTHPFTTNMPVYPGDPSPTLIQVASISKDGYTDHQLSSGMHIGTHIDSPLHMLENGPTIDQIPLDTFFGRGVCVDARGKAEITAALLENVTIPEHSIVLIYTDFGKKYGTYSYFEKCPVVRENFARKMIESKVKIVGIDLASPDESPFSVHKTLLGNGILIIENLANLDRLVGIAHFDIIALPLKLTTEAAWVRVVARVEE